jgi:hypothetical protein
MIGGAVMTSLMLPLSGDPFEPPAKAIVDNWAGRWCNERHTSRPKM